MRDVVEADHSIGTPAGPQVAQLLGRRCRGNSMLLVSCDTVRAGDLDDRVVVGDWETVVDAHVLTRLRVGRSIGRPGRPSTKSVAHRLSGLRRHAASRKRSVDSLSSRVVLRKENTPTSTLATSATSPNRRASRDRRLIRRPAAARRTRCRAPCAALAVRRRLRACGGDSRHGRRATSTTTRSRTPRSLRRSGSATGRCRRCGRAARGCRTRSWSGRSCDHRGSTSRFDVSTVRSATVRAGVTVPFPLRRRSARIRARSSSSSKGFGR